MSNSTIFDDVLRTIQERLPRLLIPLVNEVFDASYGEDTEVTRLPEGYQKLVSKVVADSCSRLGGQIYHLECQSTKDGDMVLRMVEYDFMIALAEGREDKRVGKKRLHFPKSCIIYLRSTKNTVSEEILEIRFADGQEIHYHVPVLKLKDYTIDEIFEKNLLILLPYYIMNYEEKLSAIAESEEKTRELQDEYKRIIQMLSDASAINSDSSMQDLLQLMRRVMDYMLRREQKLKQRMGKIMGGKVLRLPSDRLREEWAAGKKEGIKEGIREGISIVVETCQEENIKKEKVISKLMKKYAFSEKEATMYVEEYWK